MDRHARFPAHHILALTLTLALTAGLIPGSGVRPVAAQSAQPVQSTPEIRWSDYTLEVGDSAVAAQLGRLTVPERHAAGRAVPAGIEPGAPGSGTVELAFVRLASRAANPGPPVVYLDGGPGGSGYGIARVPAYYRLFDALRDRADVILLSQRGTGLSRPRLVCGLSSPLPDDFFTTRERIMEVLRPEVRACANGFRERGVDLGAYNTRESADDVESLRRALGADSLSLLGFSYGTHLGLSVLRRHGDRIARAVLIGTEGPDGSLKLPSTGDLQLHHLAALAAADPAVAADMPDLEAAIDTLLQRLDAGPVRLDIQTRSGPRTIDLGGDGMRYLLRRDLGDTNDHPLWPAAIRMTLDGDLRMVTRLAQRRFNEVAGVPLMAILMDCASGGSPERMAWIRADRAGTVFGAMMDSWYPDVCDVVPEAHLDAVFRSRFASDVPTLFLAGTLDANTPPYQAYRVSWGWPNATVMVVDRSGHETLMPWPPAQHVIAEFLAGEDVTDPRLELPAMEFVSVEAAKEMLGG